jgi:hypothetical protein
MSELSSIETAGCSSEKRDSSLGSQVWTMVSITPMRSVPLSERGAPP